MPEAGHRRQGQEHETIVAGSPDKLHAHMVLGYCAGVSYRAKVASGRLTNRAVLECPGIFDIGLVDESLSTLASVLGFARAVSKRAVSQLGELSLLAVTYLIFLHQLFSQ